MFKKLIQNLLSATLLIIATQAGAADPHRVKTGFFDIHVCNWPDQPLFFMALFSTKDYANVISVTIADANGRVLGDLNLDKFMAIRKKDKLVKKVFISHFDVNDAPNGWYTATVKMKDGLVETAKDYVIAVEMPQATGLKPGNDHVITPDERKLSWKPVPGAKFYQVFIRDMWQGGKTIFRTKPIEKTEVILPEELLAEGGLYTWKVHARDINEHELLGDFNHGSLSPWYSFEVE